MLTLWDHAARAAAIAQAGAGAAGTSQVDGGLVFRNFSMSDLADRLSRMRGFGVDRPVLDKTALKGAFDFTLKLADNNADLHNALEGRGEPLPRSRSGR